MHIVCVGGGPAGLYTAILMKRADPDHRVVVVERNSRGHTSGWGVVFWDDLLDGLRRTDPPTAQRLSDDAFHWQGQHLMHNGRVLRHPGGGCGIGRAQLLEILTDRAIELGVDIEFDRHVSSSEEFASADVIVAADGVNSCLRQRADTHVGTTSAVGQNMYVWLGTDKIFDAFTFPFECTKAGWIWAHAYAFGPHASTFIVECRPETWRGLGLDALPSRESVKVLEQIFERPLAGGRLMSLCPAEEMLPCSRFRSVSNDRWYSDNTVFVGDAAHTTHFSIGSGTRLAMEDAIALTEALRRFGPSAAAFASYQKSRKAAVTAAQSNARLSALWFEQIARYGDLAPEVFFTLLRARRDPLLPHVPPRLFHRVYDLTERIPALRNVKQQLGPKARDFYSRVAR